MATPPDLTIERATPADVDVVLAVLNEAARWVVDRGAEGWQPGQWRPERLLAAIEAGETFLARDGETVLGTVTLQWKDERFWPGASPDGGYVHRLAVAADHHGEGVGKAMLEWAAVATRQKGRAFLRLDCAARNPELRTFYESLGFRPRGEISFTAGWGTYHAALYEKPIHAEQPNPR